MPEVDKTVTVSYIVEVYHERADFWDTWGLYQPSMEAAEMLRDQGIEQLGPDEKWRIVKFTETRESEVVG